MRVVQEAIVVIGLTIGAFVSTSLDNLFLLLGFMSGLAGRPRNAALGYVGAMLLVLFLGLAASYGADLFPGRYASYLGFVPLALGLSRMVGAIRRATDAKADRPPGKPYGTIGIGAVMLANMGDSFAVFIPLFAETREPYTFVILFTAFGLSLLWCFVALWIAEHPALQGPIQKWGGYLLPFVLVVVGLYILSDTGTDTY